MRQKTRQIHIGGTWCLYLARCDGVSSSSKRERREVSIQPNLSYHLLVGMNQEGKLNSSFLWGCFFYGLRTIHTQTKLYKIPEKTTAATVLTTDTNQYYVLHSSSDKRPSASPASLILAERHAPSPDK